MALLRRVLGRSHAGFLVDNISPWRFRNLLQGERSQESWHATFSSGTVAKLREFFNGLGMNL